MFKFKISTKIIEYDIELPEKVTFLRGLSGTGKSLLLDAITSLEQGYTSLEFYEGSDLIASNLMWVLPSERYQIVIDGILNTNEVNVIFIDEDNNLIDDKIYFNKLLNSNNILVVVSRDLMRVSFQYSMSSVKKLESTFNGEFIVNRFVDFYNIKDDLLDFNAEVLVTEDTGNLNKLLSSKLGIDVVASGGAYKFGNLIRKILATKDVRDFIGIVDNSNLCDSVLSILFQMRVKNSNLLLVVPYSSEQFLLSLLDVNLLPLSENTLLHFNYLNYDSVENFLVDKINEVFYDKFGFEYNKNLDNVNFYFNSDLLVAYILNISNSNLGMSSIEVLRLLSGYIPNYDVRVLKIQSNLETSPDIPDIDLNSLVKSEVKFPNLGYLSVYSNKDYVVIKKNDMLVVKDLVDDKVYYKNCDIKLANTLFQLYNMIK